jgi:ABC-2 type transport system ATP-binding protein
MSVIQVEHLCKQYTILNRREGILGAMRDLFSKDYKVIEAVNDISFEIQEGDIVGYIGPNGAGKSTTIKMMTGILKPTSGKLLVNNIVPYENRQRNAQDIGVIFGQRSLLWWNLPVIESFKILKEIYQVADWIYSRQMSVFNDLLHLNALYSTPVRNLSLGQRMLCEIAAAFLHNPKVMFLDEPTVGLDISVKNKLRTIIKELNKIYRTTIILTTHDISDIEALCKRIIIIDKGKIIFDGPIEKVNSLFGVYRTLKIQVLDASDDILLDVRRKCHDRFSYDETMLVESIEPGWLDITINQDVIPLIDTLNFVMKAALVKDVKIVEISMENIVQKIYDGGVNEAVSSPR